MKRKIDDFNQAEANGQVDAAGLPPQEGLQVPSFPDLHLDPRLLQALAGQNFRRPTLVQSKAIPLVIDGKDVLAKSKTGSGKTAAYVLPILQSILRRKTTNSSRSVAALILVPTRELADQVHKVVNLMSAHCANDVRAVNIADKQSEGVQQALLSDAPDVVISTPAKALANIKSGALSPTQLEFFVLDEADLIMSYGYEDDLRSISELVPSSSQKFLASATLTSDIDSLKGLFCRNPVLLDLEDHDAEDAGVVQYYTKCGEAEKFILAYIIFKLKLIKGKSIVFVSDVDRCYRLKLYFEQFGIHSCVLNSELPVNSRIHVVEEFNRNVYDIIIASDESEVIGNEHKSSQHEEQSDEEGGEANDESQHGTSKANSQAPPVKKKRRLQGDREYGVSRGIDFKNVACVLNFDLPTSSKSYTHRIGRTARAGRNGMALSFVIPHDQYRKHPPTSTPTTEKDEKVLARIIKNQKGKSGKELKPYLFDMAQINNFRYRANDALKNVTKIAIRVARTKELRQELLNSEKLKRHFEENPNEMRRLRHDNELRTANTHPHLKHVPDYLLPKDGQEALSKEKDGLAPFRKHAQSVPQRKKVFKKPFSKGQRGKPKPKRKSDPLKSFKTALKNPGK